MLSPGLAHPTKPRPPSSRPHVQSVVMAQGQVTEEGAYGCAGRPLPQDIEAAAQWLLNDPLPVALSSAWGGVGWAGVVVG